MILSKRSLNHLASHKYVSGGYTPLDRVFYKYWWDPVLEYCPLWLAPNTITIIGFLVALVSSFAVIVYVSKCDDFSILSG